MNVNCVSNRYINFTSKTLNNTNETKNQNNNDNPVSKAGEKAILAKSYFIAGLGIGAKLLFELAEGDFVVEKVNKKSKEIVSKQNNLTSNQRAVRELGVMAGLTAMFVAGFALLYTLFKSPEINYKGNVNAFKNQKDMDIYIKSNSVERDIYTKMNEKAKNANNEEKAKLREQYLKMQTAKNTIPDFVNRK